jgi:cysteate synthase
MWFDEPIDSCVKLVVSKSGSDYFDAIHLANLACQMDEFIAEGGAKNIARREGMGTTTLSAVTTIGHIPDYYFQAVGSGTGAIAAYEANLRLIEDGRYGTNLMKLMVSQNTPFIPIFEAWKANSRNMLPLNDEDARLQVSEINAKVLSNRKPPYPIIGGLFDCMKHAGGDVLLATNEEAARAGEIFLKTEGNDLHPAAAVAVATLINAVKEKLIEKDSTILLNITGGGEDKLKKEAATHLFYLKPSLVFDINPDFETVRNKLSTLFEF